MAFINYTKMQPLNADGNQTETNFGIFIKAVRAWLLKFSISVIGITLIEIETLILNDKKAADTMNDYFASITDSLCLRGNSDVAISAEDVSGHTKWVIIKYSKHQSITKIRSSAQKNEKFCKFQAVSLEQMNIKLKDLILQKRSPLEIYLQNF